MSEAIMCDLCGKRIEGLDGDGMRRFKVKEWGCSPFDFSWRRIDCHANCVKKLLSATEPPKEEN